MRGVREEANRLRDIRRGRRGRTPRILADNLDHGGVSAEY